LNKAEVGTASVAKRPRQPPQPPHFNVPTGFFGILSLALLSADPAEAAKDAAAKTKKGDILKKLDSNGDGKISRAEFEASGKGKAKLFDKLDTNNDGFLTKDELSKIGELKKKKNNN